MRDGTVKALSALHTALYRLTRGRVGLRLPRVAAAMLLLTTTGRSSGRPHTVPLLYLEDGDDWVVIASYGGRPHHPDWYRNLVGDPTCTVQIADRSENATAATLDETERATWWPRIVAAYPGYDTYQSRTHRQIPVVRLSAIR